MLHAVADVGNSRIKLCRCDASGLILPVRGLDTTDRSQLVNLLGEWDLPPGRTWGLASTSPRSCESLVKWAESHGDRVVTVDSWRAIPIRVDVDEPDRVGIDRLLNAFAASRRLKPGEPAILIDAGSAVTVDLLDESGAFAGGTIFPGLRLMALTLNEHTAQLPLVDASGALPEGPPGKNTVSAIHLGIAHAVAGGIDGIIRETASRCSIAPTLFLTGGDMTPQLAGLLQSRRQFRSELRPALTLEGIYHAASLLA